jgi:hypothetical protein
MQHLDEGTVHAWLDGALPADEAEHVARHVDECRDCAAMVAEARGMIVAAGNIISSLDHVRGGVIPASTPTPAVAGQHSLWRRLRLTPARAALAATLLVAVASLLTVRRVSEPGAARVATSESKPLPVTATSGLPVPSAAPAGRDSTPLTAKKAAPPRPSPTSMAAAEPQAGARDSTRALNAISPKPEQTMAKARSSLDSVARAATDRAAQAVAAAPPAAPSAANVAGAQASKATDARGVAERQLPRTVQLQEAMVTGLRSATGEFEGCYQIRTDSTSSALAPEIPLRFALMNTGNAPYHGVRSVSPEGRIDSVVPGGSWQRLTAEVVRVQFANAREEQPLTLQLTTGARSGQASIGGQSANVPVARIECRR